jgi:hypothetical protein
LAKKLLIQIIAGSLRLEGGEMKNFDQWTEDLSKEIFIHTEEDTTRVLSRLNEMTDEDYEEE